MTTREEKKKLSLDRKEIILLSSFVVMVLLCVFNSLEIGGISTAFLIQINNTMPKCKRRKKYTCVSVEGRGRKKKKDGRNVERTENTTNISVETENRTQANRNICI